MSKVLHRSLEAKLAALNGPEWDSSDDEAAIESKDNNNKSTKKENKTKQNNKKKSTKTKSKAVDDEENNENSSIIYIGHIPPAFEELQILKFFSQFGKITNIKLSRAKRTGNSRGYAFVQFDDKEVAAIVAETMGGYFLMGERRLVCHIVPKEKVHPKLFQGSKRNLQLCQNDVPCSKRIQYWQDKEREVVNKERSMDGIKKITKRLLSREKKKREQLKALGIDYDFPGYQASLQTVTGDNEDKKDEVQNEKTKKRKVSLDESAEKRESENNEIESKQSKKAKKKTQEDTMTNKKGTTSTPQKKSETNKEVSTEVKKKKNKKRRKSVA